MAVSNAATAGTVYIGLRVVRGPDWQYQQQDDGEGHLGTVTKCNYQYRATVQWDCGMVKTYCAGLNGLHDLRIYDNAPCGVRHWGVSCSECNVADIAGMLWKCSECSDSILCSKCYMSDLHDTSHAFKRHVDAESEAVVVPPRKGANRICTAGLLPGAVVMRSESFESHWPDQDDDGDDLSGKVLGVVSDSDHGCRNCVLVQWQRGPPRIYPVGREGLVGVQYRIGASGGIYYPDHLPVLKVDRDDTGEQPVRTELYKNGCRVWSDYGEQKQQELGQFEPEMLEVRGRIGLIQYATADCGVVVEHYRPTRQLTYHSLALYEATAFKVGDYLLVDDDEEYVRACQVGRFGSAETAGPMVGKVVEVIKVHDSGDLRVKCANRECTLNPACCTLVDKICNEPIPSTNSISSATADGRRNET